MRASLSLYSVENVASNRGEVRFKRSFEILRPIGIKACLIFYKLLKLALISPYSTKNGATIRNDV